MFGVRHIQALMITVGMMVFGGMSANMNVAIVAMTDKTQIRHFDWPISSQSVILSSYFWGYLVLQIPAGEIANRFGAKSLYVTCGICSTIATFLTPFAAYYVGWKAVSVCRIGVGLASGFIFPASHNFLTKWAPLEEKSKFATIVYAGLQLGATLQSIMSGFIADAWGWEWIFFVGAIAGMAWTLFYTIYGASSPQTCNIISEEEKQYIQSSLEQITEQKKLKTPWKAIATSIPFWSLIIVHAGFNWGFWTLGTEIPSYIANIFGVNIAVNGVLSSLPNLALFIMSFPFGFIADYAIKKEWSSISNVRKVINSFSFYAPALGLIALAFAPEGNLTIAVALLTITTGFHGAYFSGFLVVHTDMAPNFSATLIGITNTIAGFASVGAPLVAAAIVTDESDSQQWRTVFYIAVVIYVVTNTIFIIFGTAERQSWNEVEIESPDTDTNKNNHLLVRLTHEDTVF